MAEKLVGIEGLKRGLILQFDQRTEWVIGRDPTQSQLVIEDPLVSRAHASAKRTDAGIEIENLSTSNPLLHNDAVLEEPYLLKEGDQIQIGGTLFAFSASEEQPAPEVEEEPENEEEEEPHDTLFEEEEEGKGALTQVHFDLLETGRWVLKVVAGPNNGAEFALQAGHSYVIGTDAAHCDIIFHDISVSRQHARLTLSEEGQLRIEDLGSRNGTFIEEQKIDGPRDLEINKLVTIGTSTFIVIDQEGERNTIISPLLPSIVKVLQKEIKKEEPPTEAATAAEEAAAPLGEDEHPKKHRFSLLGAFILITLISGIFALAGVAFSTLFKTRAVVPQKINYTEELSKVLSAYPAVRYSFNEATGRLLLVGHVLTSVDQSQLLYDLHSLPFVKDIDNNIVIDEYVWREINQVLAQNPDWRAVAVIAPAPGKFILTGYLDTRKQADSLAEYMNQNFPYPDLLENKVVVKDDLMAKASIILAQNGLGNVQPVFSEGDIKLVGVMASGKKANLTHAIEQIKGIYGVRTVINLVIEQAPQEAVINISDKYHVSGTTTGAGGTSNVVINGKLLGVGDVIDGMRITTIAPNYVLLERSGVTYRIDYNQY